MEQNSKIFSTQPYPGTQAVLRAIHLLKAFSDERPELSLAELAGAVHLKKTTAFRLLTALESEGLVGRGRHSEAYRLGPEILALSGIALRSNDLRTEARSELERLAAATGETATLEILVEGEMLILDEVPGSHLLGSAAWIGTRWPLHATSTGKALLAYLPEAQRQALLYEPLAGFTPKTITRLGALQAELEGIRRLGYACVVDELEPGYVAIGAPVFNWDRQPVAAISLGGAGLRLTQERIPEMAALVLASARKLSARLGS